MDYSRRVAYRTLLEMPAFLIRCSLRRHGDIPWLPRLSTLLGGGGMDGRGGGKLGGGDGSVVNRGEAGSGRVLERFETLGVNEGDSSDFKKVTTTIEQRRL